MCEPPTPAMAARGYILRWTHLSMLGHLLKLHWSRRIFFLRFHRFATRCPQSCFLDETRVTSKLTGQGWCSRLVGALIKPDDKLRSNVKRRINKEFMFVF